GKLVFFIGLAVLALVALRQAGIELPATVPESLVVIALGAMATIFVLIRLISIPEQVLPADGRGIGIWIRLFSALGVLVARLLAAGEELERRAGRATRRRARRADSARRRRRARTQSRPRGRRGSQRARLVRTSPVSRRTRNSWPRDRRETSATPARA